MTLLLPPVRVPHPHVTVDPVVFGGSPFVRGTKIPVRRLWAWHRKGVTVETLVKRYVTLGWARVLSALAFAYDNEDLVEADLDRERMLLQAEPERVPGRMVQEPLPFSDAKRGAPRGERPPSEARGESVAAVRQPDRATDGGAGAKPLRRVL